jgi:hypothetical protein
MEATSVCRFGKKRQTEVKACAAPGNWWNRKGIANRGFDDTDSKLIATSFACVTDDPLGKTAAH